MNQDAVLEPDSPAASRSLWCRLGRFFHGLAMFTGYSLLIIASCMLFHDLVVRVGSKLKQEHDHIQTLIVSSTTIGIVADESEARDFDGDGKPDQLHFERIRVEPFFGGASDGYFRVTSGRTGELLLSHPGVAGFLGDGWCGDYDRNGTEDIVLKSWGRWTVLGYVPD